MEKIIINAQPFYIQLSGKQSQTKYRQRE